MKVSGLYPKSPVWLGSSQTSDGRMLLPFSGLHSEQGRVCEARCGLSRLRLWAQNWEEAKAASCLHNRYELPGQFRQRLAKAQRLAVPDLKLRLVSSQPLPTQFWLLFSPSTKGKLRQGAIWKRFTVSEKRSVPAPEIESGSLLFWVCG